MSRGCGPLLSLSLLASLALLLPSAGCGSKGPPVIASTKGMFTAIAADATGVVWVTEDDRVYQLWYAPTGGKGRALGNVPGGSFHVALDAKNLYWSEADTVRRVPRDAANLSAAVDVGTVPDTVEGVAVDASHVYMIDKDHLLRVPVAGGPMEDFWKPEGFHLNELALAGGALIVGGTQLIHGKAGAKDVFNTEVWRIGPDAKGERIGTSPGLLTNLAADDARIAWMSSVKLGEDKVNTTSYVIGVSSRAPATKLDITGTIRLVDGPRIYWQGDGALHVLDASGVSTKVGDSATRMCRGGDRYYVEVRRDVGAELRTLPR